MLFQWKFLNHYKSVSSFLLQHIQALQSEIENQAPLVELLSKKSEPLLAQNPDDVTDQVKDHVGTAKDKYQNLLDRIKVSSKVSMPQVITIMMRNMAKMKVYIFSFP